MAPPGIVAGSSGPELTDQLEETWSSLEEVVSGLPPGEWAAATDCPGWSVGDVVAHVVGTESMLLGRPAPDIGAGRKAHVRNEIGELNERWVTAFRSSSPEEVVAALREVTAGRLEALRAMREEDFDAPSWTPVGEATYRRFMQIRVFDCWVHEQDVRLALGRPGHRSGPAAEQALDEVVRALGYLVGKKAAAPAGSKLTLLLTGPLSRTIHVAVDGRAAVVESLGGPATASLELDGLLFTRLACGRVVPSAVLASGAVSLAGDAVLGRRVIENLAFTI